MTRELPLETLSDYVPPATPWRLESRLNGAGPHGETPWELDDKFETETAAQRQQRRCEQDDRACNRWDVEYRVREDD